MRIASHPGEIIREEYLKPNNLTNGKLAKLLHVTSGSASRLLSGKNNISAEMALRLSKVFGTTAMFWVNLQTTHDISIARNDKVLQAKLAKLKPFHTPTVMDDSDDD